jgi:A/G-specific adenine glycosylase
LAGSRAPSPPQAPSAAPDAAIARSLIRWFRATARDLPWRDRPLGAGRDPYRVLVSELMLQQTQASRVAERFDRFLERFPTVGALAAADEAEVLALWSGSTPAGSPTGPPRSPACRGSGATRPGR